MKKLMFLSLLALFAFACENETHTRPLADLDALTGGEQEAADDAAATPDNDTIITPDIDTAGTACELDSKCGDGNICVAGSCTAGCTDDGDCTAYPGTTCNTETHRCLNETANDKACGDTRCPTGCCYAEKGFRALKCLIPPSLKYCGMCAQGEVYLDRTECVPAACSTGDTNCQTYNAYDVRAVCYECKTGDLLCYDNPACN